MKRLTRKHKANGKETVRVIHANRQGWKRKLGRWVPVTAALLFLLLPYVHADSGQFTNWLVPDAVTKSLDSMHIFFLQFMTILYDVFTVLLFILWMLCIAGIIYSVYYILTLPSKIGARNYHEAVTMLSMKLWNFMR